jgi:hypothetical protein
MLVALAGLAPAGNFEDRDEEEDEEPMAADGVNV